jgi:LacI family transcriptional regulator
MKDIAMIAGVSRQAVSAVLNNTRNSRVSEEKRNKILRLARELNYVPNAAALSLSGNQTKTIGILGSIYDSGFNTELVGEISRILITHGYNILTGYYFPGNYCATTSLNELVSRGVDGVIIHNSEGRATLESNQSVPYLFYSHYTVQGYDVGVNNEQTGYVGTRHLLEHGHKQVIFLTISSHASSGKRKSGWQRAHQEAGIEVSEDLVVNLREFDGRTDRLIEKLKQLRATAIFASNDYIGAKTIKALIQKGIRIPDDIAIVGCDGYSFTEFCPVSLTTVIQPVRPQAEIGAKLLLERIKNKELHSTPAKIEIQPLLHLGGSCGCKEPTLEELYTINSNATLEKDMKMNFGKSIIENEQQKYGGLV